MTPNQFKGFMVELRALAATMELWRRQNAEAIDRIVVALSSVN